MKSKQFMEDRKAHMCLLPDYYSLYSMCAFFANDKTKFVR